MFVGHAAVALAAKPLLPRVNLAWPLLAVYWVDLVWPLFLLLGIEQVKIDPGNTAFTPLDFVHYPWTHSLLAGIAWGILFALLFWKYFGPRSSIILGLLDALSHRPDLPLWPGSGTRVGLGLWYSVPATLVVELSMFAIGVAIYASSRKPTLAFWSLIGFLLVAYFANAFGPPPPSVDAIAAVGIVMGPLFGAWAWWADRKMGSE